MSFFLSCRSLSTLFRFQLTYSFFFFFFFNDPATTEIYTLSLHDALPISGFGAVMRQGSDHFHPDAAGFYHLPYITVEVAQRVAAAGISVLAIDCTTVECQTQGQPLRMTGDVHPVLLGHAPPAFILEGVAGRRIAP